MPDICITRGDVIIMGGCALHVLSSQGPDIPVSYAADILHDPASCNNN